MNNEQLNKFMAEEVMGLVWSMGFDGTGTYFKNGKFYCDEADWHPTTDIAQAIECVEKLCTVDANWRYKLLYDKKDYVCLIWNYYDYPEAREYCGSGTKELAVCRAICEAVKGGE